MFVPWLVLAFVPDADADDAEVDWPTQPIGLEWLATTEPDLSDLERAYIETACRSPMSVLVVEEVTAGRSPRLEGRVDRFALSCPRTGRVTEPADGRSDLHANRDARWCEPDVRGGAICRATALAHAHHRLARTTDAQAIDDAPGSRRFRHRDPRLVFRDRGRPAQSDATEIVQYRRRSDRVDHVDLRAEDDRRRGVREAGAARHGSR